MFYAACLTRFSNYTRCTRRNVPILINLNLKCMQITTCAPLFHISIGSMFKLYSNLCVLIRKQRNEKYFILSWNVSLVLARTVGYGAVTQGRAPGTGTTFSFGSECTSFKSLLQCFGCTNKFRKLAGTSPKYTMCKVLNQGC